MTKQRKHAKRSTIKKSGAGCELMQKSIAPWHGKRCELSTTMRHIKLVVMMNDLLDTVERGFLKLKKLGGLSEANAFLLYAYLQLWNRVGAPVHVVHTFDQERGEDVFIARFSKD